VSETCYQGFLPDRIRPYRILAIDRAINNFKGNFEIKSLPIDCVQLAQKINAQSGINIKIMSTADLPKEILARTHYIREADLYLIAINRNQLFDSSNKRAKYPFVYSSDRMLNFTLAHEFGHIFLGHAEIPDQDKTDEIKEEEELEANEFAGRLLMPAKMLNSCNYYSMESVAEYFIVSKTALRYRLNIMGQSRLIKSKKIRSCSLCGNTSFSPFAEFCRICGESIYLRELNGIRRVKYPDQIPMDRYNRVILCPFCKKPIGNGTFDRCLTCGTYIFNLCSSFFMDDVNAANSVVNGNACANSNPGNARFCEICGKPTYFYVKGWLDPWQEVDDLFG